MIDVAEKGRITSSRLEQPSNKYDVFIDVTVSGMIIFFKPVPLKAAVSICITEEGISIAVRALQFKNAEAPIIFNLEGSSMLSSAEQLANALLSITVRSEGSFTFFSKGQPENVSLCNSVIPSGISIDFILELVKAY